MDKHLYLYGTGVNEMSNEISGFLSALEPIHWALCISIVFVLILIVLFSMGKNDEERRTSELKDISDESIVEKDESPTIDEYNELKDKYDELQAQYRNVVEEFDEYVRLDGKRPEPVRKEVGIICADCGWKGGASETLHSYGHTLCPYCRKEFKELMI